MELKPSTLLKRLGGILEIGSHINMVADVFGAVFRGIEPGEKAHAAVKGLYGIFGMGDERKLAVLLDDLERRRPRSRAVLTGFFEYHAPKDTAVKAAVSWYFGNQFRTFLGKMGQSDGRVEGKKTHTITYKDKEGKDHKEEIVSELRRAGDDNSLDFLESMVATIDPEGRVAPDPENPPSAPKSATKVYLEAGYERLLRQFIALGYPHVPQDVAEKVEMLIQATKVLAVTGYIRTAQEVAAVATTFHDHVDKLEKKQGRFTRLLKKIL